MTIGGLARACGVGVETVRYYQRRGLLERPPRPPRGVRRYGADATRRLKFVRRAQAIGFSLDDIAQLLRLEREPDCVHARHLAERKLADIEEQLAGLGVLRKRLRNLIEACAAPRSVQGCPIVDSIHAGT